MFFSGWLVRDATKNKEGIMAYNKDLNGFLDSLGGHSCLKRFFCGQLSDPFYCSETKI